MVDKSAEWLKQAEYDLDTAEFMFTGGGYFYSVFMCHLSIEKALKGLYQEKLKETPPKTHNLIYLIEKIGLKLPEDLYSFIFTLNRVRVPTRYPDDLQRIMKDYNKITKSKEVIAWLKKKY